MEGTLRDAVAAEAGVAWGDEAEDAPFLLGQLEASRPYVHLMWLAQGGGLLFLRSSFSIELDA